MTTTRQEISAFAGRMEEIMGVHDKDKGDSWKKMAVYELRHLLQEEFCEWSMSDDIVENDELVDIANVCMMIWINKRKAGRFDREREKRLSQTDRAVNASHLRVGAA